MIFRYCGRLKTKVLLVRYGKMDISVEVVDLSILQGALFLWCNVHASGFSAHWPDLDNATHPYRDT